MGKFNGMGGKISKTLLQLLFGRTIRQTEKRLKNDPEIKELTEKINKSLDELEKAADDHINTFWE